MLLFLTPLLPGTNNLLCKITFYNCNAGMNLDWKWPVGFTPLSGSRSMVDLAANSGVLRWVTLDRWHSSEIDQLRLPSPAPSNGDLVEMTPTPVATAEMDQVKLVGSKLPNTYFQCRAGRDASFQDNAIESATKNSVGNVVGGEKSRIGSFESKPGLTDNCFVGSHVLKGSQVANQNVSMSLDPATLSCLSCPREHSVLMSNKPVCICVTDQNFVSSLSGTQSCISVIRLESGGLLELADLVIEIFDTKPFSPGSVICVGPASHLHRVGLTLYAQKWTACIERIGKRLSGTQICPLIPLIKDNIPGSLAWDLIELATWLAKQYQGTTLGLLNTWVHLATVMSELSVEELQPPSYHCVALPASLKSNSLQIPHRFRSTSSHRVESNGCCAKTTDELLSALLSALCSDLGNECHPGQGLVREPSRK